MQIDLHHLQQIVQSVVTTTLLPYINNVTRQYKHDGSIVTTADQCMQQQLTTALAQSYPNIALLGEEMTPAEQQRLLDSGKPIWCLDPIDGTSNFAAGMPFFSISLALIENAEITHGLVFDPNLDECFYAQKGHGAWLNGAPLQANNSGLSLKQSIALIDFKRLPKGMAARLVKDLPFGSQRNLGSTALEMCWLAAGRAHLYLHGSQHLWDYAAGQLILNEAGAYASTLNGAPLFSNTLEPRSTYAAVDHTLFEHWHRYLTDIMDDSLTSFD